MLKSQEVRALAPEMDPLRMGMGWSPEDLEKPQRLAYGQPGLLHAGAVPGRGQRGG